MNDKVYLGREDHYDNRGHYFNQDHSLLFLSDNEKMFALISLGDYMDSQSEMLEQGVFTQKDYAEFAALQNGVLAQFVEVQPVLFGGKPFSLSPPEPEPSATIPLEEAVSDTILDKYPMPDPSLTEAELEQQHGYQGGDLLPLSKERATELFDRDFTIYAIVDGGEAEIILDLDDIESQPIDNIFAVPREEWEVSPDFRQAVADQMDHQEAREQAFLGHAGDCFAIYQLRHDEDLHGLRYESLDRIHKVGQSPVKGNYELVYTSEISPDQGLRALDTLWEKFNTNVKVFYRYVGCVDDVLAQEGREAV